MSKPKAQKSNKAGSKSVTTKKNYTTPADFVNYFLMIMFAFFPFYYTKQFSNIRHDKYNVFMFSAVVLTLAVAGYMIYSAYTGKDYLKRQLSGDDKTPVICSTDIFFLVFLFASIVSTLMSGDIKNALTGDLGRNNGLLLILGYTLVYFFVSRFYEYKTYIMVLYVLVSSLVCGLAILNFFYVDPLNIFANYAQRYVLDFSSTIGNKNLMSSFSCMSLAVCFMLYITGKSKGLRVFYLVGLSFSFCGTLVADSDSGFIGIFAAVSFAFLYCVKRYSKLRDFFTAVAVMLFSAKVLRLISFMYGDKNNKGLDSFAELFVMKSSTLVLLIIVASIAVGLHLLQKRFKELENFVMPKFVFVITVCVFATALVALGAMFYYFSVVDTTTELTGFLKFFRFNYSWGTHRGYMWIKSIEVFSTFDIKGMLFGCGPDLFRNAFEPLFKSDMISRYGETTNCAHNEYLNYLVTTGIIGALSYIGIIVTAIVKAVKNAKELPLAMVFACAVVAYCSQAVVNISQPITTPIMIIFLSMLMGVIRNRQTYDNEKYK